jgi:hypothetical protein
VLKDANAVMDRRAWDSWTESVQEEVEGLSKIPVGRPEHLAKVPEQEYAEEY